LKGQKYNARDILYRYIKGQCTQEEQAWVEDWYKENYSADFEIDSFLAEEHFSSVWQDLQLDLDKKSTWSFRKIAAIAASVAIILGISTFYLLRPLSLEDQQIAVQQQESQIKAGRNQALLTLGDGQKIHLDNVAIGDHVTENNIMITKLDDGTLVYTADALSAPLQEETYHTISTPRGGQYKVVLPDHSIVWLNAASSLRFPTAFKGSTRTVELIGEGYFEITHHQHKPFIVMSQDQQTIVKGTKFNITAYPDDPDKITTLLQGSVLVKNSRYTKAAEVLLQPNEQAILQQNTIVKSKVEATDAVAWKNGKFIFNDTPLQTIMQQLARWYDIEVVYSTSIKGITFTGAVSRFDDIQDVLRKISLTESIQFETKGRRVMVRH